MVVVFLTTVIKVLFLFLIVLWCTIAASLIYRRRRTKHLLLIESTFADITSHYLYPFPSDPFNLVSAQRKFREVGIDPSKPRNVQYLIDLMIRTQRNLRGNNYNKLEVFYKQIPPYRVSLTKLHSKNWYIKSRGIREIYEMDQKQYIKEIFKEVNNKNLFVRREAQIALVVFLGWESMRFLPYLQREMSLWQQIKVVEKLYDLYPQPKIVYLKKAYYSDKAYANELVMRLIRKFNIVDEVEYIYRHLDSDIFDTREAAIYCLSSFKLDEKQLDVVKHKLHNIPNIEQQVQLLKYIDRTSPVVDIEFYKLLLNTSDDIIRLSAAEILWNKGFKEQVQEYYYQQYTQKPQVALI